MKPQLRLVKGFKMPQKPAALELEAAIERYLSARQAVGAKTLIQYRRVLNIYKQISPGWPPTSGDISDFIKYCQGKYGQYTVHTYFGIVRGFIHFLVKARLITDDPLGGISAPRRPGMLPRAPQAEHLKKLILHLESEVEQVLSGKKAYPHQGWHKIRNLALFSLMLDSGLRVSEAVNVRIEDIDFDNWSVFVRKGKGTKQREVPLGRTTRADLKLWLNYRALIPIPAGDPGAAHLFISRRNGWVPMGPGHVKQTLRAICEQVGIKPFSPHQLRHAFASYSHDNGAKLENIRQWLGHSDLTTTARYLISREGLKDHLKSSPRDHQF